MTDAIVVYITAPSEDVAVGITRVLLEKRLVACVSIVPGLRSIYRWEGKIEDEREVLMIAKTRGELFESVGREVKALHPYKIPEVIAVRVVEGSREYLEWIVESTS